MSSKSSRKAKKPLDLPLGKAISSKDVDLSHVRLPIDTSVFGLKHVLTLFETATSEVKSYLAYECDLMYECRVCRTIFRSIANFVLHKRKFCREKHNTPRDPGPSCRENDGVTVIQRDIDNANQIIAETEDPGTKTSPGSYLDPIIENLLKRQEQKKFVEDIIKEHPVIVPKHEELKKVGDLKSISLEKIDGSDVAVFQTMEFGANSENTETMKSEVMEIHSIFDRDEAVIGSNGKILTMNSKEKDDKPIFKTDHICTECNTKFSTKKTLTHHIKYKHSETKLVYPCPVCKDSLSNAWSVYRHLLKVHRMTSNQIRKYRNQIHNSAIFKRIDVNKDRRKNIKESGHGNDEENEWLDNIEGDSDLQMCGGCGKHFDRKAALTSHSVMCTKRIAVCNSIKENNSKKKELDIKSNEERFKTTNSCKLTGSAKRKSAKIISYKPKIENANEVQNVEMIIEKIEEKEVTGTPSLIIDENDSDGENCTEWTKEDFQIYDKDIVMSIIGVESVKSLSSGNISSKASDRSDSPCRGFDATESSEYIENVKIEELSNLTNPAEEKLSNNSPLEISDDSKDEADPLELKVVSNDSKDEGSAEETSNNSEQGVTVVSNDIANIPLNLDAASNPEEQETRVDIPPNPAAQNSVTSINSEYKITELNVSVSTSNLSSKSSSDSEVESSSEISLDNKENSDFQLDLGDDPNFQDVSIKLLIKEIMEEDATDIQTKDEPHGNNKETSSVFEKNPICNGLEEEKITKEDVDRVKRNTKEKRLNNNYDMEIIDNLTPEVDGVDTRMKKRKRKISPPKRNVKQNCSNKNPNEIEDEVFLSRISQLTDMSNFRCTLCETPFSSMAELMPHMSNHLSWYRFQCSRCSFMSFDKFDCENHVLKEHKLPWSHIQGTVLPIPTWKSALISDNSMLLESPSNDTRNETTTDLDSGTVSAVDMIATSLKLETIEEHCGKDEKNILGYVDLTIEENSTDATNCVETTEDCLLKEETGNIQDLSKQAIMEVILGNENRKEKHLNKCITGQSCEHARPMRNRTKSVKTSQKDFIYDFVSVKGASIKAHSSKVETETSPEFEVHD